MSLLRQIQDAAVSSEKPIGDLLRNCKILGTRLNSKELCQWVDSELNGYPSLDRLPDYRILKVQAAGYFSGSFGSGLKNAPIPVSCIPEEFREWARVANMTQPISAYEDLFRDKESASFKIQWPSDLVLLVGEKIYEDMNCLSAWQVIPRGAVVGLLENVRSRILNFALEIEKTAPDAGEAAPGSKLIPQDHVGQAFHTTIYGNVGNISSGGETVAQTAHVFIAQGDLASLKAKLTEMGFGKDDVRELEAAIKKDSKTGKDIGKALGAWMGKAFGKAGSGLLNVTVAAATELLPKLISQYLGSSE